MGYFKKNIVFLLVLSFLAPLLQVGADDDLSFLSDNCIATHKYQFVAAGILAALLYKAYPSPEPVAHCPINFYSEDLLGKDAIHSYLAGPYHTCDSLSSVSCSALQAKDYRDFIQPGARKYIKLINEQKQVSDEKIQSRESELLDIVSICWFLYSLALANGDEFNRGALIVHDDNILFKYLLDYVKFVNPQEWDKGSVVVSRNPYGYCRTSTHLRGLQKKGFLHYGIDMRFDGDSLPILPAGKRHLLFGRIDDKRTFIKFEDHGLYWQNGWTPHVMDAIVVGAKKYFGFKEFSGSRKEHVIPKKFVKMAKSEGIKVQSIGQMYKDSRPNSNLNNALLRRYPLDVESRMGNEVILNYSDLQNAYYYDENVTSEQKVVIESKYTNKNQVIPGFLREIVRSKLMRS